MISYRANKNYYFGDTNSFNGTGKALRSAILSGSDNTFVGQSTFMPVSESVIAGGRFNKIEVTVGASASVDRATISGGRSNTVTKTYGTIGGGINNQVNGRYGTIPGGEANIINGDNTFAAGKNSQALHNGSWVWTDASSSIVDGVKSTANNQFLIRAVGGVGIGTNAPASPLHVKGQGTSTGSTTGSNEVVMTIEPKVSTGGVAAVINKLDATKESALIFSTSNNPNFDLRMIQNVNSRDQLDFNHYKTDGTKQTLMSLEYYPSPINSTIFMNADVYPDIGNTYDIGSNLFRWSTIYAQNPLDTPSDKRLKKDIKDMSYGLAEVLAMRPVTYHWKKGDTKRINLGLIAQEVETIVPEIVQKADDAMQTRSMRYSELIPVLIKATQEQQVLIDQQSKEITELKSMLKSMLTANKTNK